VNSNIPIKIIPVVLSGGSGSRLWPLSRSSYPKQFLPGFLNNKSMFQETLLRLDGVKFISDPIIICNEDHRFLVVQQLQEIEKDISTIILEPEGRNTAPAIVAAALSSIKEDLKDHYEKFILVLPSDHLIRETGEFHESIEIAIKQALKDKLVTFGIKPSEPYTGYGYIEFDDSRADNYSIKSFSEKPDQQTANKFFSSGNYLWNSGMFVFKPQVLIEEVNKYSKKIFVATKSSFDNSTKDHNFIRLEKGAFSESPDISIDIAVMEKTDKAVVIPLNAGWSDLGSWASMLDNSPSDSDNNVLSGKIIVKQTANTLIHSVNRTVAAIGLEDIVIVDTPDVTLVAKKDKSHLVADIVTTLKKNKDSIADIHKKVFRPWGWYDSIESGEGFQVKKIQVNPKARLSLQSHKYRSEHWVVVKGKAKVTCGEEEFFLDENESTYIPIGMKHRLENTTDVSLEIIEVQSGKYLGEDDIERFDDEYGRTK